MKRYIFKRILWLIPSIIIVSFLVFYLMDLAPGTIVDQMISGDMTQEEIDALYRQYDLDKPVVYRYGKYMLGLLKGDLGRSQITGVSVWKEFTSKFPNTIILSLGGLVVASVIAIPLGIFAAKHAGSIWDNLSTTFTLFGMSMPGFWLGLLLILWFAYRIRIFPVGGAGSLKSFVLPIISTSLVMMATTARQTRSSMLDNLRADYLRTARAKGVPEHDVINKHALKNALIPIITSIGAGVSRTMAGSAVIETVYSFPGVGKLTVDAVTRRDVTMATGCIILTTIIYVLMLLIVDVLYAFVDPRIKAQYAAGSKRKKKGLVEG